MTPNPYNKDHLVEQPALALLAELGWQTACGLEETFAPGGGSLGRRNRSEVVVLPRLRAALERLNPGQPPEAISAAILELSRNRSAMSPVAALIASNGTASRIGSLSADWERFFEWKRIASEDEPRRVSLEARRRGHGRAGVFWQTADRR